MRLRARFVLLPMVTVLLVAAPAAIAATYPAAAAAAAPLFGGGSESELAADDVPAVEVPPAEAEEDEQPWTARFLAPATLLLGVVAIGGSIAYYGVRIRGRYRVAE